MNARDTFPILLLIARPAAGKSEIIHFLSQVAVPERIARFHVGELSQIDDFPMLWTWFEEDALLSQMGKPRLYTDQDGYFLYPYFWDLLVERISLEYQKHQRELKNQHQATVILEFSRGKEHGGYAQAFQHLSHAILESLAIVYVKVSWEESLRKNRKRYNPERSDSILEHSIPDRKLERLYRKCDWAEVTAGNPNYLSLQGVQVPFVNFENEDDVTTAGEAALEQRLEETLARLWHLYQNRA
jgi:hypothetical protein